MITRRTIFSFIIASIAGLMFINSAFAVPKTPKNWEKCLGVSLAEKNDCGAVDGSHQCAGQAKKDRSPKEWIYVPEGTCAKLGGKVGKVVAAE